MKVKFKLISLFLTCTLKCGNDVKIHSYLPVSVTNPFLKMVPKKFSPFSVDSLLSHKEKAQRGKGQVQESVVKSEPPVLGAASNLASPPTSAEAMTKFLLNNNLFSQDGCDDSTKKNSPGITNNASDRAQPNLYASRSHPDINQM